MAETEEDIRTPTLLTWFAVSLKIGLFSFGGGISGWMLREFVFRHRWMTEPDFLNDLSVARIFPGTNVSNFLVIAGYRLLGPVGAAAGLLGLVGGPFLIVIGMVQIYGYLSGPVLDQALQGAGAAAVGLVAFVIIRSLKNIGADWPAWSVLVFVAAAIMVFRLPLLPLILCTLPVSLLLNKFGKSDAER